MIVGGCLAFESSAASAGNDFGVRQACAAGILHITS
jgi:hypothetical protein